MLMLAWTNTNRVNKANQFTPRPVQLSNIRPILSTASNTIKTGRVNVNTGHGNVCSGRVYVNTGTQFKSGGSRFNTGHGNVNSGRVNLKSPKKCFSKQSSPVNRPVLSNQTSQVNLKSPKKCFSKQSSPVNRPCSRHTAYKSNIYAVKGTVNSKAFRVYNLVTKRVEVNLHVNFLEEIGSLMYLTASRPDIMYAVCVCSRFQVTPKI
ncbi:hypothetical protein Tco_0182937 [Tanacetum coccineum]